MSYEVLWIMLLGPYTQHFIFFVTFELSQQARVLHYSGLERLIRTNTLTYWPHMSYEVLWIMLLGLYSQLFIFFATYEWAH